jgi:hypothetical protein
MLTVTVDGKTVKKYSKLPEDIRAALRAEIPSLTKDLAARVRAKLQPGVLFKTTTHILPAVRAKMVENTREIFGTVYIDGNRFPNIVAHTLESGSVPHEIVAKHAKVLYFFWAKLGVHVAFKRVHHPGFGGRSYMQSSLDDMWAEIRQRETDAIMKPIEA